MSRLRTNRSLLLVVTLLMAAALVIAACGQSTTAPDDQGETGEDQPQGEAQQYLQQALDELGYDSVDELPALTLVTDQGETAALRDQAIQQMVSENLGVELELQPVEFATRLERARTGRFDIIFSGWGPDYDDPLNFLDMWVTDGPYNDGNWSNEEYDQLIETASTSTDNTERMEAFVAAEQMLGEEVPIAPISWRVNYYVERPYVDGVVRRAVGPSHEYKYASNTDAASADEQVLRFAIGDEPPDMSSVTTTDAVSFDLLNATQEGLVRPNPDGAIEQGSGLAESWEVSEDGLTYTFNLRDAQWSNGDPITSHDFAFAWKWVIDPRHGAQYAYQLYHIKGAHNVNTMTPRANYENDDGSLDQAAMEEDGVTEEQLATDEAIDTALDEIGIRTPDDQTLVVELEQKSPFFLGLLAFPTYLPVNQDFFESQGGSADLGGNYALEPENMLASGPFIMTEWQHDSEVVLEKNPDYWDAENVQLQRLEFPIITDNSVAVNSYEAGEIDAVGLGPQFLDQYRDDPGFGQWTDGAVFYLDFNMDQEITANKNLRKAISLAIDRKTLCENVLNNTCIPATSYTPPVITDSEGNSFQETWVGEEIFPSTAQVE